MCGIVAYHSDGVLRAPAARFIEELFVQSRVRGLHASGIAYLDPDDREKPDGEPFDICVYKDSVPPEILIGSNRWKNLFADDAPTSAILHTRYSTSGDWQENRNNQPLVYGGRLALVHNGLVSMADKSTYEAAYGEACSTANDSEIILRKIVKHTNAAWCYEDAINFAIKEISAVERPIYACALLTDQGEVYGWCDSVRPLYAWAIPSLNLAGFCSTKDIYERAAGVFNLKGTVTACEPGKVYNLAYRIPQVL